MRLVYICVDNPEQSLQRVHERVAQGGHDVPEHDVRRRYGRSLANLAKVARMADEARIYDNSGPVPTLLLEFRSGVVTVKAEQMPTWIRAFMDSAQG